MSIFFDFEVGPKGRRFRRAVDQDKVDIQGFWKKEETETLFCVDDFGSLIELSTLAIVMIDASQKVTGFMALSDHPHLPALDPATWEQWIRNNFKKYYLAYNTLFIHFMCCVESVSGFFLEEALVAVFMNDCYLQHIILVVPPTCKIDCMSKYPTFRRRSIFKRCTKKEDEEICSSLFVALRNDFCPKLRVRRAVEEDNDDIVEILDAKCKMLRELYGDYYLSEILSRHPETDRIVIVGEVILNHQERQRVVGVMGLNSAINYEKLQHTYELAPYQGLVLTDPVEREEMKRANHLLKTFGDPIMCGKWSPFESMNKEEFSNDDAAQTKERREQHRRSKTKVNFKKRRTLSTPQSDTTRNSSLESEKTNSPSLSLGTDISLMFLMDDEPLDYEIVNIDTNLLNMPDATSFEFSGKTSERFNQSPSSYRLRKKRSAVNRSDECGLLFKGKPNAFIIELFGLRDEIDDRRAFDLLEAAFECMPKYEYCIIRIPCEKKAFSLLHHFTVVPVKPHVCCKYALYIAHRNSVLGKLRVRKAEIADIPQIAILLHKVDGKETIWTVEHAIQSRYHHHLAYVILCGYTLVGVGILDPPEQTDLVRAKFLVEAYQCMKYHFSGQGLDGGIAMVKTVLVYPTFEPHFAYFARDMLRLSGSSTLLWLTAYRNKWVAHKANGIVTAMTPLPYRLTAESGLLPELKQVYHLSKNLLSFSAWFVSKKYTSISKLNVDCRIVVVGASRTAISFLYHLLFGDSATYLTFTNVTLISKCGLPYMRHSIQAAELMFPKYQSSCDRFLKSTPFTYYVNIVQGTMVEINKQNKCIVMDNGHNYYYDRLFLLMGKQYQHPEYMKTLDERDRNIRMGSIPPYVRKDNPDHIYEDIEPQVEFDTPENVFFINTIHDANHALNFIRTFVWRFDEYKVVVYGKSIHAYCCLTALLELDVAAEHIVFVEPFPPEDVTKPRVPFFCNHKVDKTVESYLEKKVKVYRGYYLKNWNVNESNLVNSVEFISHYQYLKIDCAAFFYYGKRDIDPNAFLAINRCGLAYDGGILIDHLWRTTDPSIYAAGPATRYYRRYKADSKLHKFHDSYEIGKTLGVQIRDELDPLFSISKENTWYPEPTPSSNTKSSTSSKLTCNCSESIKPCSCHDKKESSSSSASSRSDLSYMDDGVCHFCMIPKLERPKAWYCLLPGNLQYLEVRSPGAMFPHYYIQSMQYNGNVIETYKSGYFKLHINKDLIVDGITCLTPDTKNIENFKMLYGYSAVVLNNVHLRYMTGGIEDLYEFFRLPWSVFLFNERSEELLNVAKYLKPKNKPDGKTLEEILRELSASVMETKITGEAIQRFRTNFEKNFETITDYVIEWLSDNDLMLSMYITPSNMMEFTHDLSRHPAFKRCKKTIKKMLAMIA